MLEYAKTEKKPEPKDCSVKKGGKQPPNVTGIPDGMKTRFENVSGFSFDDVRVHYNSEKPAQLQALAYTQGRAVYVAPGQERHLGHELGHVVQQKRGGIMPTELIDSIPVNSSAALEREADMLASTQKSPRSGEFYGTGSVSGTAVQCQMKINITDEGGNEVEGVSNNGSETKKKLDKWPEIPFDSRVEPKDMTNPKDGSTYPRSPYMCAEPTAFANILERHLTDDVVTADWLRGLSFSEDAHGIPEGEDKEVSLPPCRVCRQWLDGTDAYYTISDIIIPRKAGPLDNAEKARLRAHEKRGADFAAEYAAEEAATLADAAKTKALLGELITGMTYALSHDAAWEYIATDATLINAANGFYADIKSAKKPSEATGYKLSYIRFCRNLVEQNRAALSADESGSGSDSTQVRKKGGKRGKKH